MDKTLNSIPWTLSGSTLALVLDGQPKTLETDHPNFAAVLSALRCGDWDLIPSLIDIAQNITNLADGRIKVCGDEVFYLGQPIANSLTDRMLCMIREGVKTLSPMCNFLENCMANPNKGAVDRIFTFLEKSHLPLTPDGCFLAYRGVNKDFTDKHTGKFDNSPGKIVKQDRKLCDEDSHQCCSQGLHFCSLPYLGPVGGWAGGTDNIIVIKINPRDVTAVPYSYGDTKGRCCRFEVLRVWQTSDQFKNLAEDAWSVSLVAETDEVTSPAVRAMLNLERINEGLKASELEGFVEPEEGEEEGEGYDPEADYDPDLDGEETESPVTLLPEEDVQVIFSNSHWTKKTFKKVIRDLYTAALRAGEAAFALKGDENERTDGDLKVLPNGRIYTFDKPLARWMRFKQNIKLAL